jgi:hypothetical protein
MLSLTLAAGVLLAIPAAQADGAIVDRYEPAGRQFDEFRIGDRVVYFHQRTLGGAVVEKDFILYHFDAATGELERRTSHWREDLPERLPSMVISREEAEALAGGEVRSSRLWLISPESDIFPLDPVPDDPCWVVSTLTDRGLEIIILNAATGAYLGNGVPPPYNAFSLTGPWEFNPCSGAWTAWMNSARDWFVAMGYDTEAVEWPVQQKVRRHIQSGMTALFYELAHGGSDLFQQGCLMGEIPSSISAGEVQSWIAEYTQMPFTFIGSCGGMCDTLDNSLSYEFRKGSVDGAVTVGYCGMAETYCSICWSYSIDWQDSLFSHLSRGNTARAAFDYANAHHPICINNGCMRIAGDPGLTLVPVIERDPVPPTVTVLTPNGGEVLEQGTSYDITWVADDNAVVDSVAILLSLDGGVTFPDTVASGETNDSVFAWIVPDLDSHTSRIRVVAVDGGLNEGSDSSDADFTLWGTTSGTQPPVAELPGALDLRFAGANPASGKGRVSFEIPAPCMVSLGLYDVAGRLVHSITGGQRPAGRYGADIDLADLGSGIYFVRLAAGGEARNLKIVVSR